MDLQSLFWDAIKDKISKEIAGKIWIDESTASSALNKVLPQLLGQVSKNASNEEGAKKLDKAIEKWHNTSDLKLDLDDWAKILSHIMWGKSNDLINWLSKKSGLNSEKSGDLIKLASSFLMENLWKAKNEWKIDAGNLSGIMKMASGFLDKDWDWDIKDDLLTMIMNFFKSKFFKK